MGAAAAGGGAAAAGAAGARGRPRPRAPPRRARWGAGWCGRWRARSRSWVRPLRDAAGESRRDPRAPPTGLRRGAAVRRRTPLEAVLASGARAGARLAGVARADAPDRLPVHPHARRPPVPPRADAAVLGPAARARRARAWWCGCSTHSPRCCSCPRCTCGSCSPPRRSCPPASRMRRGRRRSGARVGRIRRGPARAAGGLLCRAARNWASEGWCTPRCCCSRAGASGSRGRCCGASAFGCLAAALLVALAPTPAESADRGRATDGGSGEREPITVRGPLSYAGPGRWAAPSPPCGGEPRVTRLASCPRPPG